MAGSQGADSSRRAVRTSDGDLLTDEPADPAIGLVLEGPPSHADRPTWTVLLSAVVVAAVAGALFGVGIGTRSAAPPRVPVRPSLGAVSTVAPAPSATTPAIAVYFGVEAPTGTLSPGTYAYLNVDGTSFTNVRFTVPAGWEWDGHVLRKDGGLAPHGAAIFFFDAIVQVYTDPCRWAASAPRQPTGSTAAALMTALAAQPFRHATAPVKRPMNAPALASGWQGLAMELSVPADINFASCDDGQYRSWGPDNEARSHEAPGQRDLVWAADLGPYDRLIVDAAWFPNTSPEVRAEIASILRSIAAGHWG